MLFRIPLRISEEWVVVADMGTETTFDHRQAPLAGCPIQLAQVFVFGSVAVEKCLVGWREG